MKELTKIQAELFNALHLSRLEDIKTFNKKDYRGVWTGIIDKYPETAHFIYELLQNADDADATDVEIIISTKEMLFKHNGSKHFDISSDDSDTPGDINAITGIGNSSKENAQNKIGKFGVGFKAVFQYTKMPEIYDDTFRFKIVDYIVPELLGNDHPKRKDGETLFVFPFEEPQKAYKDIVERVENLQSPILFLSHLERIRIEIVNKGEVYEYSKEMLYSERYNNGITLRMYHLINPQDESTIFLFDKNENIVHNGEETVLPIYIGFYYDEEIQKLITDTVQNVFCFFPTKEDFETCYVCHAPFLLTDNRQNLKPNESVNDFLIGALAKLATQAVLRLRDYGLKHKVCLIDENIVEILPSKRSSGYYYSWSTKYYERPFQTAFDDLVENCAIFLSRNGKYLKKQDAYIGGPRELIELLSKEQLKALRKADTNIDFLKWELIKNVEDADLIDNIYTSELFARDITSEFMSKQDLKWVSRMYTFLRTAAPKLWKFTGSEQKKETANLPFRQAPIIKVQDGRWVQPYTDNTTANVFLPIRTGLSSEYNFVHEDYLNDEMSRKFFDELELKQPNELDYIFQIVIKKYGEDDDIDIDDLVDDMNLIIHYYINNRQNGEELVKKLKEQILLVNENGDLYKPTELYLGNTSLQSYYRNNEDIFLGKGYYEKVIKRFGYETFVEFMILLGVSKYPPIKINSYWGLYSLGERVRRNVKIADAYEWERIVDYQLDGFSQRISDKDWTKELSIYIWNEVLSNINIEEYGYLRLKYRRKYARDYCVNTNTYDSTFRDDLLYLSWIYNIYGERVSTKEAVLEDLLPEYIRNERVIKFLGIEKRERSILEIGATEEEQEILDFGRNARKAAEGLSDDEIQEVLKKAADEKKKKKQSEENIQETSIQKGLNEIDGSSQSPNDIEARLNEKWKKTAASNPGKPRQTKNSEIDLNADKLTKTDITLNSGPFFTEQNLSGVKINSEEEQETYIEKELEKRKTDAEEEAQKATDMKIIYDLLRATPKFTYKWYKLLMELMHANKANRAERQVQIDFSEYSFVCDGKILYLSNPTRPVPDWLTDAEKVVISTLSQKSRKIEGVIVKTEETGVSISIELTDELEKICSEANKIRIIASNSSNIIDSLETRFLQLGYEDSFDMNENLTENIEFIYGPPGTGKTTQLVKKVANILRQSDRKINILILTPTNKAADVVAEKMANDDVCYDYLMRYGATESLFLIEDVAVVQNRETADLDLLDKNVVVTTAARYAYDYMQPDDIFLCDINWDYIIIDEASMVDIVTATFILYKGVPANFIISGDPKQIPPVEENGFDYNIYDLVGLHDFGEAVNSYTRYDVMALKTQYRSIPVIGDLVSKYAYNGIVEAYPQRVPKKQLSLDGMNINDINFLGFEILEFDLIKGVTEINGSAFHLYSAIFTYGFVEYVIKQITKKYPRQVYSIGVVSPYKAEAEAINQMLENRPISTENCSVTCGTVHSFQGDECDIMFVVLNPPIHCSEKSHINKENIINVAMSRARDYLFFVMPQGQPKGMIVKNQIGKIVDSENRAMFYCSDVEEIIFGSKDYIVSNTHVSCHMPVNVYCEDSSIYEVKISEHALDIKINEHA